MQLAGTLIPVAFARPPSPRWRCRMKLCSLGAAFSRLVDSRAAIWPPSKQPREARRPGTPTRAILIQLDASSSERLWMLWQRRAPAFTRVAISLALGARTVEWLA